MSSRRASDFGHKGIGKGEDRFRMYCQINKIDIVTSQAFLCLMCGRRFASDDKGKCPVCDCTVFCRPDFFVSGEFPVFDDGSIHEMKQKVWQNDRQQEEQMINCGRLFIRVKSDIIKKYLESLKRKLV